MSEDSLECRYGASILTATKQQIDDLTIEPPTLQDAAAMHRLAEESGVLDVNSRYAYLLCARLFASSCRIARNSVGEVIGFTTAIVDPEKNNTLFVWQVAVDPSARGLQLGARMVADIVAALQVRMVEATVTPGNAASTRMFARIAEWLKSEVQYDTGFAPELFAPENHEEEELLRIATFPNNLNTQTL